MGNSKGMIYKITNMVNGKGYVGQTISTLVKRIGGHRTSPTVMGRAFRKYGEENFKIEILLSNIPVEKLDEMEEKTILAHGTLVPSGYNTRSGGKQSRGHKLTEDQRKRVSEALKGNKYNLGKKRRPDQLQIPGPMSGRKFSEEHKRKIGEAGRKRVMTEEQKLHLSKINTGKKQSEETKMKKSLAREGWKMSDETKNKISIANTGRKRHTPETLKAFKDTCCQGKFWSGRKHSEESKKKISVSLSGIEKKFTQEHIANIAAYARNRPQSHNNNIRKAILDKKKQQGE